MPRNRSPLPKDSARLFAALGDATRLALVFRLLESPLSISRLTEGSQFTRQAITKHLKVMEQAGLVRCSPQGRETLWQLRRRRVEDARHYLDLISRQWDEKLDRLKAFVEN